MMAGLLLVVLAVIETILWILGRPLLSRQRGWRRAGVVAAWVGLGLHLEIEARRMDAAGR